MVHLLRVRAAEYGIPIFRLCSSGISQCIDSRGNVLSSAAFPGQQEIIFGEIRIGDLGKLPLDRWVAPAASGISGCLLLGAVAASIFDKLKARLRKT